MSPRANHWTSAGQALRPVTTEKLKANEKQGQVSVAALSAIRPGCSGSKPEGETPGTHQLQSLTLHLDQPLHSQTGASDTDSVNLSTVQLAVEQFVPLHVGSVGSYIDVTPGSTRLVHRKKVKRRLHTSGLDPFFVLC